MVNGEGYDWDKQRILLHHRKQSGRDVQVKETKVCALKEDHSKPMRKALA